MGNELILLEFALELLIKYCISVSEYEVLKKNYQNSDM